MSQQTGELTNEQIREFIQAAKVMNAGNVELTGDGLDLFRSVMDRRPPSSQIEDKEYNRDDDPDAVAKQKILEDFTSEVGCCYIQLVTASDTVLRMEVGKFAMFLISLRENMGKFPLSIEAANSVAETYGFFNNRVKPYNTDVDKGTARKITVDSMSVQEEMLQSGARFKLIETSAGYHLSATTFGPCGCPNREILCDHGWAARYVLCAIVKPDRRLGASEIDFNAFFVEEPEESEAGNPFDQSDAIREAREKLERIELAQDLTREVEQKKREASRRAIDFQTDLLGKFEMIEQGRYNRDDLKRDEERIFNYKKQAEEELREITERRDSIIRSMGEPSFKVPAEKPMPLKTVFSDLAETLLANDSASAIIEAGVHRRFMSPGTVVADATTRIGKPNVGRLINTRLPDIQESAIGFVQTEELYAGDVASRQAIIPINGLSRPFNSSRMNLLGHIYTGLNIISRESESDNLHTTLYNLRKSKLNSPPVQLFRQVLNSTFDWEEGIIKSNPFNLPYIEVGMTISEDSLIKCFDLLNSEYKNLWFSEMKQMQVPPFAQEYNSLSDFSLKGSKRNHFSIGSKTSESQSSDRFSEGSSHRSKENGRSSRSKPSRKDSLSSTRSSILGFPMR